MGLTMAKHPLRPGYALLVCDVDAGNAGKGAARRPDDRPVDVLPFSQKRRFDLHQLLAMNFN